MGDFGNSVGIVSKKLWHDTKSVLQSVSRVYEKTRLKADGHFNGASKALDISLLIRTYLTGISDASASSLTYRNSVTDISGTTLSVIVTSKFTECAAYSVTLDGVGPLTELVEQYCGCLPQRIQP